MATMFQTNPGPIGGFGGPQPDGGGMAVNVQSFLKPARKRLGTVDAGKFMSSVR